MKQTLIIILILIVGVVLYLLFSQSDEATTPDDEFATLPSETGPDFTRPDITVPDGTVVQRIDGEVVQVRDFLSDDDIRELTSGVYILDSDETIDGTLYEIFYYELDNSITVSLQSEPLPLARQLAEERLIARVGTNPGYLCDLAINVTTPGFVSDQYSGRNLGLSFCQGSVSLE